MSSWKLLDTAERKLTTINRKAPEEGRLVTHHCCYHQYFLSTLFPLGFALMEISFIVQ